MKNYYPLYAFFFISQFVLAFICGPYSCEWGNSVYFGYGVLTFIGILFLPFLKKELTFNEKITYAFTVSFFFVIFWVVGFVAGGLKVLCRLF